MQTSTAEKVPGKVAPVDKGAARGLNDLTAVGRRPLWTRDFLLTCLANFALFSGFQMLMPTLPLYIGYLGGQESIVGLIVGLFAITAVGVRPWVGLQLDRSGRRGIFLAGLVLIVLAVLGYSLVSSVFWLAAVRLVHGLGWGAATTAAGTVATDIIPPLRRGEGMSYYGMFPPLAMALAPAIGLALVYSFGFNLLFYISAGMGLLAFLLAEAIRYHPLETNSGGEQPALFEKRALTPSAIAFCIALAYGGVVAFLPFYALEQGVGNIGLFFTVYAVGLTALRPLAGVLYDRRGPTIVVVPGLVSLFGALLVLASASNMVTFLVVGALMGIGFGLVVPAIQAMSVAGVPPARRGAANGTFFSAFDLGIGLGAVFLGLVAENYSYQLMYLMAAAMPAAGLIVYILVRPGRVTGETV